MSERQMLLLALAAAFMLMSSLALASAAVQLGPYSYASFPPAGQASTFIFEVTNTGSSQVTATFLFVDFAGIITWSSPVPPTELASGETKRLTTVFTLGPSATRMVQTFLVIRTAPQDDTPAHQPIIMIFPHLPGPPLPSAPLPSTPSALPAPLQLTLVSAPTLLTPGALTIRNMGTAHLPSIGLVSSSPALSFSPNSFALAPSESRNINLSFSSPTELLFGTSSINMVARDGRNPASNVSLSFTLDKSFCSAGAKGTNLSINNVKIRSSGKEDNEWKILDEITIEVEVENRGTTDLKDVVVQLGLFDSQGRDRVNNLEFDNKDEKKIEIRSIKDDKSQKVTFKFKVGGDIDDGNYKLTAKAFSKKTGEAALCTDRSSDFNQGTFQTIKIEREDDKGKFIAFNNPKFSPTEATCGDTVMLTTEVVNVGDEDQDRVKVLLKSPELKVNLAEELRQGLDIGDDSRVTFTFTLPQGLADKTYSLALSAEYDFRSSVYRQRVQRALPLVVKHCARISPSAPALFGGPIVLTAPSRQVPQQPTPPEKPTAPLQQEKQPVSPEAEEPAILSSLLTQKGVIPLTLVILNMVLLLLIVAVAASRNSTPSRLPPPRAPPARVSSAPPSSPEKKQAAKEKRKN